MKETPIIFQPEIINKILDGICNLTFRVIKPQPPHFITFEDSRRRLKYPNLLRELLEGCPYGQAGDRLWCKQNYFVLDEYLLDKSDILYRLTDDRICAILTMEVQDERYKTDEWSPSQAYPNLPERGLHGGVGWSNLLTNKIQRLWAEGIRGLVSAQRTQQWQGLSSNINVPQQPQGNEECSPSDMYSFSWDATIPVISDQTFRRKWSEQLAEQFALGHSGGELVGQEDTRSRERGRKTPNGKANRLPDESSQVGDRNRISEPKESSENTWDVAGWHLRSCPPRVLKLVPSIFMPRWASRIMLERTESAYVKRTLEITEEEAKLCGFESLDDYRDYWNYLNKKRGFPFEDNVRVWGVPFGAMSYKGK